MMSFYKKHNHSIRIMSLVILILFFHCIDLYLTLYFAHNFGFFEANPIAFYFSSNIWSFLVFKLSAVSFGCICLLFASYKRKRLVTSVCWGMVVLLFSLSIYWSFYIVEISRAFEKNAEITSSTSRDFPEGNYIEFDK